eukprot:75187_1
MSQASSDDFSDIEYTQTKNDNISDVDEFGDFSPTDNEKLDQLIKTQNNDQNLDSDPNDSFGSDVFETEHHNEDEYDISSKPEIPTTMNRNADNIEKTIDDKSNMNENRNSDLYYNPRDYDTLEVNNEIRRLFEYIERFKCNEIELETQLKPFIPDYIPSIGNVDSFLKPTLSTTNYDQQENNEKLGIQYLDEPILNQSDPSTFYLKLSNESKQVSLNKHTKVSYIADAEKNTNKIRNWIDNFKKIKNKSLSNNVCIDTLSNMPKVEELMQPYINDKFNNYITDKINEKSDIIPSYNINMSLEQYAKIICNILDIPVQNNDIKTSLHLLFSTYAALQSTSDD